MDPRRCLARSAPPPPWGFKGALDAPLQYLVEFDRCGDLGLLCDNGIFVIDFDTEELFEEWYPDFKETFDRTAMAKTRKGYHVWLRRTPLCDELNLHDGPMGNVPGVLGPDGKPLKKPMDIKSLTGSKSVVPDPADPSRTVDYYTPGFCAVYPSPNKVWIRSVLDTPMLDVPEALARRLLAYREPTGRAGVRAEGKRRREFTVVPSPATGGGSARDAKPFWRACELDLPCLAALGFRRDRMAAVYEYSATKTRSMGGYVGGTVLEFQMHKGFPCPLCGKAEGHDNSTWVAHLPDGSRKVKSMSPVCFPTYVASNGKKYPGRYKSSVDLPWSPEGVATWTQAMRARSVPAPAVLMEAMRAAYSGGHPFADARDGFIFESRRLVFTCKAGVAVVAFGPGDETVAWPTAAVTQLPWMDKLPADKTVPLVGMTIDAFRVGVAEGRSQTVK